MMTKTSPSCAVYQCVFHSHAQDLEDIEVGLLLPLISSSTSLIDVLYGLYIFLVHHYSIASLLPTLRYAV